MINWRKIHRWVGLVIGIQVLLWIAGGVYMSAVPLNWVHGKHLISPPEALQPPVGQIVMNLDLSGYQSLNWIDRAGAPVLEAVNFDNEVVFLDPMSINPKPLEKLEKSVVQRLAGERYVGEGALETIEYLEVLPSEASGIQIPVYRVLFDDWCNTTFYMHPFSGKVLKVRSDIWRLFDIFWMLHIMDYETRDNFNNPLLIGSAVVALIFTVTGMMLVFTWISRYFRRRRQLA